MGLAMDQLTLEGKLSSLITSENVKRVTDLLAKLNPAVGMVAGIVGAVIVRAAKNINEFIEAQWSRPIVPPDILVPMNYDMAVQYLKNKGLDQVFAAELKAAETETDLWQQRKKRETVAAIATVISCLDDGQCPMARAFFSAQLQGGDYRAIWNNWSAYQEAYQKTLEILPVPEVKGILSIAFGNHPLQTLVPEVLATDAASGLKKKIQEFVKQKFGAEVDLDDILSKIS